MNDDRESIDTIVANFRLLADPAAVNLPQITCSFDTASDTFSMTMNDEELLQLRQCGDRLEISTLPSVMRFRDILLDVLAHDIEARLGSGPAPM